MQKCYNSRRIICINHMIVVTRALQNYQESVSASESRVSCGFLFDKNLQYFPAVGKGVTLGRRINLNC